MRKRIKNSPRERDIEIERDGEVYRGTYSISGGMITVRYDLEEDTTQFGGHIGHEGVLARLMLASLVRAAKRAEPHV